MRDGAAFIAEKAARIITAMRLDQPCSFLAVSAITRP
jgi:hypothetical protein